MTSARLKAVLATALTACVSYAPAPSCKVDTDCPAWHCECGQGRGDARYCNLDHCAIAEGVCHDACKSAGSCWQGRATGGWTNGNSVGQTECTGPGDSDSGPVAGCGDDDFPDVGARCGTVADCASGVCLGATASFICVKRCSSNAQCPSGWVCSTNQQGFQTCFIGAPEDEGRAVSTNASCAQVGFSDIGMACQFGSDCQSGICFGDATAGFYCSRRCNEDGLCVSGWHCATSAADSARFCQKP